MKKIVMILTNSFDPDPRVHKEAKYLTEQGFDVEILCWDRETRFPDGETETVDGIHIRRFYPQSVYGSGAVKQGKAYLKYLRLCRKYLKSHNYDYLHCHDLDGAVVGILANSGKRTITFDMHEYYVTSHRKIIRSIQNFLVRLCQKKSDYIIYLNEKQLDGMNNSFQKKLVFLPNYPLPFRNIEKTSSSELRISFIGNIRFYDTIRNLLEACIGLPIEVFLHGFGTCKEKLEQEFGTVSNYHFTGRFTHRQLEELYCGCDMLYCVYSSDDENNQNAFPNKFFESIVTETPIIVNHNTKMAEFVAEKRIGLVVNGDSVDDIREKLFQLLQEPERLTFYREQMNELHNNSNYSWDKVVINLRDIYQTEYKGAN